MVLSSLLGKETQVSSAGCFELSVRPEVEEETEYRQRSIVTKLKYPLLVAQMCVSVVKINSSRVSLSLISHG